MSSSAEPRLWLLCWQQSCEPFADKMQRLTREHKEQLAECAMLEQEIKKQLGGLGFEI